MTHGKSWCHAKAAQRRLSHLVLDKYVELRASYRSSSNLGRPLRSIYVKHSGDWDNVQRTMLKEGKVLWFPQNVETVHNKDYQVLMDRAATRGQGIWNPTTCGYGPHQHAQLSLILRWDASGSDEKNRNGENVRILNKGDEPVRIGGWHVRDTSLAMYTFPHNATVPAHGSVVLHSGHGTNPNTAQAKHFHWNLSKSLFGTVYRSKGRGDAAFLLDRDGDFRSFTDYPCVISCADPATGHITMSVHYHWDHEYVRLSSKNTSHRVWLTYYQLRNNPWTYVFPRGSYLDPGETMIVHTGRGRHAKHTRLNQFMHWHSSVFTDSGDNVDLSNLRDTRIACVSWGSGDCHYNY
jgi:hypothetical protein